MAARRVYLVRHGVTEWNRAFRYQGSSDVALSPEGEEQAERAGLRLAQLSVGMVISSPLVRSLTTAQRIARQVGVSSVEMWDDLREVGFGDWEGLTVREIIDRFGKSAFEEWKSARAEVTVANGEEAYGVYERAGRVVERLGESSEPVTVVVTHGALLRALLLHLVELPLCSIFWKMRIDNCSISAVEFGQKGERSVLFFNDTVHLLAERGKTAD